MAEVRKITTVDPECILVCSDTSKSYGGSCAVNSVSFNLFKGEILGIIGPNGAGKTTLMECVAGLIPDDGGEIHFMGAPLPHSQRHRAMFYLPDGIVPWGEQPVWRVTGLFRELHGLSLSQEYEVVKQLELIPVLAKRGDTLSKGYHRRFLLALALLTTQPILILDEPFDGFDLRQTLRVMSLLREIAIDRTLVLSIHQLKDAERVCDRLLLLDAGRRLGLGTLSELALQAGTERTDLEEVFLDLTK